MKQAQQKKTGAKPRPATEAEIEQILGANVVEVLQRQHLANDLRKGTPLRVKLGADPSAPDLHLGHAIVLRKLKEFQDFGHTVVFIIGDYTARIGDPTGKSKTRPQLDPKTIAKNAETYFAQVGKILDLSRADVHFNSEWFEKMRMEDVLKLAAQFTAARTLERDDFTERQKIGADIGLHELLYPAMQAYDSVMTTASVEIGGTDQKFNMLAGRDLQRKMGLPEQDVITCPLLVGTDGVQKMSKSLGNYIALTDTADDMYGKLMSIPDSALLHYFELAAGYTSAELARVRRELEGGRNPRDLKMELARAVVTLYHSSRAAERAEGAFERVFRKKEAPQDMPVAKVKKEKLALVELLIEVGLAPSKGEARRVILQGGVKVDGIVVKDPEAVVAISKDGVVLQKGKRHFIRIKSERAATNYE